MKRFNSGASNAQVSARLALAAAIAAACVAPAFAQEAAPAAKGGIEEVIVTGTKRAESSQDVPIAVTAVSSEQMEKTFRNDILAVSDLAPGVALGQMAGFRAIAGGIRGTGQNGILVTQDSSVAILVDEFGLNNVQAQFVETFDVERIEVYRGPQGTLFGKNATGGAISIVTKRPVMNEMGADVQLQYGKYSEHSAGIGKAKVALNIPVIDDVLAIRMTAIYDYEEGYFRNNKDASNFPYMPIFDIGTITTGTPSGVSFPLPDGLDTTTKGSGEHLGGVEVFAGKFKMLWTPTENYEAYFFTEHMRDRSDSVPNVNDSPALGEVDPYGGPQFMLVPLLGFDGIPATGGSVYDTGMDGSCWAKNAFCLDSGHRVTVNGYHLHQKYETDKVTYQFLAGYREQKEILPSNYVGETFMSLYDASRNLERESTQFELRASTSFDGPFNFVAGLTYQTDDVDMIAYQTVGLLSLVTTLPDGFLNANGQLNLDLDYINDPQFQGAIQDRKSYAGYFDGTYEVTDRWRLTGGLRYTKDKKEFNRRMNPGAPCGPLTKAKDCVNVTRPDGSIVQLDRRSNAVSRTGVRLQDIDSYELPGDDSLFGLNIDLKDDWQKVTWRLVSNYDITDDAMWYVSLATGFISGGFTEQCSSETTCVPFDPETNTNLETGLKSRWFDGTVQANLAAYLTRYKDLVRSQVVPFVDIFGNPGQETVNVNAGESEIYGLEAELSWMPIDNLRLDLNTGYQHHEYEEFDLNGQDLSDLTVPYSPKWKVGASATYTWDLGGAGYIAANTSVNYQSQAEMSVFNSLYSQMGRRTLWDANITWSDAESRYDVTFWVKNILDQQYRIGSNSVAGLWNMTTYGRPQSMGIEVGVHF